jgi:hypothetical protein
MRPAVPALGYKIARTILLDEWFMYFEAVPVAIWVVLQWTIKFDNCMALFLLLINLQKLAFHCILKSEKIKQKKFTFKKFYLPNSSE